MRLVKRLVGPFKRNQVKRYNRATLTGCFR
jgi:hypothetical protein